MISPDLESGLAARAKNFSIKGLICAVPKRVVNNDHFFGRFGEQAVSDVVKMIGVQTRRWVNDEQTTADLCQASAETLMSELGWERRSVDALVFISQTPDYRLPTTACALQKRLQLKKACVAFDVNLGCSGYVYGLWLVSRLLDGQSIKRALLLVGDTISKTTNPDDRSTALLFGDAGSATAIEYDENVANGYFILGTDGGGERNLMIPEGGYRKYHHDDARLTGRDPSRLFMDGGEIFNFTLKSVPQLVDDLLLFSDYSREKIDAFLFHQANQFMVKHLIKKSKIPPERAPINIDRFGNTSSASIPLLISDKLPNLVSSAMTVAMFGFGVGYSWSAAVLDIRPLAASKIIEL